jgi:hypothetical protein
MSNDKDNQNKSHNNQEELMLSKYFTFLYNECKRLSNNSVNSEEIRQFINTPQGKSGFESFCKKQNHVSEKPRPKSIKSFQEKI